MAGMDDGPGTNPGGFWFFLGTWTVMMVAMMLPSAAPTALHYRFRWGQRPRGGTAVAATGTFVIGYIAVWVAAGMLGYTALKAGASVGGHALAWNRAGRWTAAGVLAAAALYELTPLKRASLRRCRHALGSRRAPRRTAQGLNAGVTYGGWCLGCCLGLMPALFALGEMSLVWMALLAVIITAQKLLPWTRAAAIAAACILLALAVGLAATPAHVPGLIVPGGNMATMAMH
jgi:predicted metal-binding membrane protein